MHRFTISPNTLEIPQNDKEVLLTVVMDTAIAPCTFYVISAYTNGKRINNIPQLLDMELDDYVEKIKQFNGRFFRNSLVNEKSENAIEVIHNIIQPILENKGLIVKIQEGIVY